MTAERVVEMLKRYQPFKDRGLNIADAAKEMGMSRQTLSHYIHQYKSLHDLTAVQQALVDEAMTPMERSIPPGTKLKGTSVLYRRGEIAPVLEWVKTSVDEEAREAVMREFAEHLSKDIVPLPASQPPTTRLDGDLLSVYPMGDPHVGMLAWWQDAGEDFNLTIAERLTCGAIDRLVASAPPSKTGLLLNLGDMFHADNQKNVTNSGHQLDVDGRWKKVQQVGLRAMIYCVRRMLEKHETVIFRINGGNHDGHSSYALALMLDCYFAQEPRVQVDLSPSTVWYYQFGKVLIGSTHGDTIKGDKLIAVMAADMAEAWGQTRHRHWYVGHVHHKDIKEYSGGTVEYVRTLAARDAWHAGQGYRAGRDMQLIVHHIEHGELERHRCDASSL